MSETDDLVIVYSGTLAGAETTKIFLEAEGVQAFVKDEMMGVIAPWQSAPGGAGAVKVMVGARDVEEARALLGLDTGDKGAPAA